MPGICFLESSENAIYILSVRSSNIQTSNEVNKLAWHTVPLHERVEKVGVGLVAGLGRPLLTRGVRHVGAGALGEQVVSAPTRPNLALQNIGYFFIIAI